MIARSILLLATAVSIASCGTVVFDVEGDKFEGTNKVGVILVASSKSVKKLGGDSGMFGALSAITSMATGDKEDEKSVINKIDYKKILNSTVSTLESEFGGIGKFTFVPASSLLSSSDFKAFASTMDKANKELGGAAVADIDTLYHKNTKSIYSAALFEALIESEGGTKYKNTVRAALKKLSDAQSLEGLVMVNLNLGYAANTAIGGTGTAAPAAVISMRIITPQGETAALGNWTGKSEETVGMVAGGALLDEEMSKLINEAVISGVKFMANNMKENNL